MLISVYVPYSVYFIKLKFVAKFLAPAGELDIEKIPYY